MNNQHWVNNLRVALKENALPHWYIDQFVREFQDHFDDMEDNVTMQSNSVDALSNMGSPTDVAENARSEFNRWSYLQRHPACKRLAMGTLAVGFLITGVLVFNYFASRSNNWFHITTQIAGIDDTTLHAPTLTVEENNIAIVGVHSGSAEYQLEVTPSDVSPQAKHSVKLRRVTTETDGHEMTLYSPTVHMNSNQSALIGMEGITFTVAVSPAGM
jgi:hypothetical protein